MSMNVVLFTYKIKLVKTKKFLLTFSLRWKINEIQGKKSTHEEECFVNKESSGVKEPKK